MRASAATSVLLVVAACGGGDESAPRRVTHAAAAPLDAGDGYDAAYPRADPDPPPDASTDPDDASPAPPPPAPISAPDRQWTWTPIDGMQCANGSPTGVGVSLVAGAQDVLIFLEGGGACWDASTCYGAVATSFYLNGYGAADFAADLQRSFISILSRDDATNPFRAMSMIYVPYCTGDVHAGDKVTTYVVNGAPRVTRHVGARNVAALLARVVATYPRPRSVWVAGDSAGGFGAALEFGRVQAAFPTSRVGVLDDSGQPIQPSPDRWKQWKDAWGLEPPADCAACADDVSAYVDYYRLRFPDNRFGLISYQNDAVITTFMGLTPDQFVSELGVVTGKMDTQWPYAKYFLLSGALHVGLANKTPEMTTWLQRLVAWDPAWSSVKP